MKTFCVIKSQICYMSISDRRFFMLLSNTTIAISFQQSKIVNCFSSCKINSHFTIFIRSTTSHLSLKSNWHYVFYWYIYFNGCVKKKYIIETTTLTATAVTLIVINSLFFSLFFLFCNKRIYISCGKKTESLWFNMLYLSPKFLGTMKFELRLVHI